MPSPVLLLLFGDRGDEIGFCRLNLISPEFFHVNVDCGVDVMIRSGFFFFVCLCIFFFSLYFYCFCRSSAIVQLQEVESSATVEGAGLVPPLS